MKITREFLKRMINEELNTVLNKKKKLKEITDDEYSFDEDDVGNEYVSPSPSFEQEVETALDEVFGVIAYLQKTGKGSPQLIQQLHKLASELKRDPDYRLP